MSKKIELKSIKTTAAASKKSTKALNLLGGVRG